MLVHIQMRVHRILMDFKQRNMFLFGKVNLFYIKKINFIT
jgi:hypothetical protein